jgi:hypothetical protein
MLGTIDSDGIQNGCTKNVLTTTAMTRAVRRRPGSSAQNDRLFFLFGVLGSASPGSRS